MKWTFPAIRPPVQKMKPMESAVTDFHISKQNVFHLHIDHDLISGVTTEMLEWWFKNIGGEMNFKGSTYPRYLVWHPEDHIHWELVGSNQPGSVGPGSRFRIVEAFNHDMRNLIDSVETVTKLDKTGIRLERSIGGLPVFSLEHTFIPERHGTGYFSRMIVGSDRFPLGSFFNRYVRPRFFTEAMGYAWLKHNVEEVGNFELFLPDLYAKHHQNENV